MSFRAAIERPTCDSCAAPVLRHRLQGLDLSAMSLGPNVLARRAVMAVAEQVYPHLPVARTAWAIRPHEEEITRQINGCPALLLEWLEDP
jgi:hypothetical protein